MTKETKDNVQAAFQEWMAGKERKSVITSEMKENVEAAAELLDIDKKRALKLFKLMESDATIELSLFQLYQEVSED